MPRTVKMMHVSAYVKAATHQKEESVVSIVLIYKERPFAEVPFICEPRVG